MLEQLAYDPDEYSKPDLDCDSDSSSDDGADDSDDSDAGGTEYAGSTALSSHGVSFCRHRTGLKSQC